MIQNKPNFKSLEDNLIDIIKEEQIKLGYREETLRLYYPMESLNSLMGIDLSVNELEAALDEFCNYVKERLGDVTYSRNNQRFCIVIPSKGVTYVHKEIDDRCFLKEFIEKIMEHHCKLEDILTIFYQYSDHVVCNQISNGEFDYLIYFEDGNPDSYRYCIKFEDCHVIYHRFTRNDYESFGF